MEAVQLHRSGSDLNLLARPLDRMRRESIKRLALQPGERVLVVGAGTGLDLDYLPQGVDITAIDLTPAMLDRLRRRAERLGLVVDARVMNAHALDFADGSFDAVILHLILAVIPDPVICAREAARVLRPSGRAVVMDKFVSDDKPTPALLKAINPILDFVGTSVDRKLGPILAGSGLRIVSNDAAGLGGYYRTVLVKKG
jgi:ubiquinone/menaquinone biosynthesis C-methylase UbiE